MLTIKWVVAEMPPFWCKHDFLPKHIEANIFPEINKTFLTVVQYNQIENIF